MTRGDRTCLLRHTDRTGAGGTGARDATLAAAPAGNVVTLHPAALSDLFQMLTIAARHLPNINANEDRKAYNAVRSLIKKG